jgi:hypothetical protein
MGYGGWTLRLLFIAIFADIESIEDTKKEMEPHSRGEIRKTLDQ